MMGRHGEEWVLVAFRSTRLLVGQGCQSRRVAGCEEQDSGFAMNTSFLLAFGFTKTRRLKIDIDAALDCLHQYKQVYNMGNNNNLNSKSHNHIIVRIRLIVMVLTMVWWQLLWQARLVGFAVRRPSPARPNSKPKVFKPDLITRACP